MPAGIYDHHKTKTPIYTKERNIKIKEKLKGGNSASFKKGSAGYWLNKKRDEEWKENARKRMMGYNNGFKKGHVPTEETKIKIGLASKGRKKSKEQVEKTSGKNHWNWRDGASFQVYPKEFNKELKQRIRERDNFTCCLCGKTEQEQLKELNRILTVNHIDFNKQNCKENNLNTLCCSCNFKINAKREFYTDYFNKMMIENNKLIIC